MREEEGGEEGQEEGGEEGERRKRGGRRGGGEEGGEEGETRSWSLSGVKGFRFFLSLMYCKLYITGKTDPI